MCTNNHWQGRHLNLRPFFTICQLSRVRVVSFLMSFISKSLPFIFLQSLNNVGTKCKSFLVLYSKDVF